MAAKSGFPFFWTTLYNTILLLFILGDRYPDSTYHLIRRFARTDKDGNNTLITMIIRRRRQVAVMLVVNGVMLLVNGVMFFTSSSISNILAAITVASSFTEEVLTYQPQWLILNFITTEINSCINPIVYGVTNREYRRAFREYLFGV